MRFEMNKKQMILSLLILYSISASGAGVPLIQIDDMAISQEKARLEKDFATRNHLAKVSYTMLAGGTVWFAYKWGVFNYFSSNKLADLPPLPEESTPITHDNLLSLMATIIKHTKDQSKKVSMIEAKNLEGKMHWFIEGAKYVGLTGFSLLAGIVVQSKWQKFFDYALASPTFDWFYGSHSMMNRLDSLRYHIAHSIDTTGTTPQAMLDFHHNAIEPTLETVQNNLKELIAFSEYYFDQIDAELVAQFNLDGAPRFLFNTTNDFFAALKLALDANDRAQALALTDAFRAELSNYNKDCQSFENVAF